ncbi:FxDxF family PEP-CTERM protein [Massilia sp. P8910]|uniref:PEP-CTERM sorting domain-containing protein n=1 Tax=Massilia antarctica TaxID=2765360 RepID=A0AA49A7S5_9BURK|nr:MULTISPECIES: FxDxF family PEP-CTERM protein [Massilia]MCE3604497.1 FxDxF family PEP-CTERM protein [Massilia antarctica]MCY0913860.1 FxDxF family PEP-CTERM protein [Massilia sp. H27-R4]QPI49743.1 PEP-CTERM sorting domain-containing protein [Massilia antarctica]
MKKSKVFLSAIALASAALVSSQASAIEIINTSTLQLVDNFAEADGFFKGGQKGNTFVDNYKFTLAQAGDFAAGVLSITGNAKNGLDITAFNLIDSNGSLFGGKLLSTGATDQWSLSTASLSAGAYTIQVKGSILSNSSGRYSTNIALAPVPEPETYAMMLAGLGLLGFTARRRNKKAAAAALAA